MQRGAYIEEHRVDAIVAPTGAPGWLTDWVKGDYGFESSAPPAAIPGYPRITVPAGFVRSASRSLILWALMERTYTHQTSILFRASHKGSTRAKLLKFSRPSERMKTIGG